jgi:enediyne biosynthesis protein E4
MASAHRLSALLLLTLAGTASAQVSFDLIEINKSPGPSHPGVEVTFVPVSDVVAEAQGISVADVNNDGLQDLLVCGTEGVPNRFYVNDGDGTFTESAAAFGIQETAKRRGNSVFFDLDNDGDLDLATFGYAAQIVQNFDLFSLYRNDGPAAGYHFTDITASSGGFVLAPTSEDTTVGIPGGSSVADYDRDGYLDVIVTWWHRIDDIYANSHDQFRLWKNVPNPAPNLGQPDYTPRLLVDATLEAGLDGVGKGWIWMPRFVDVDRDGWPDLHLNVEMGEDELRLNNRDGTFGPNLASALGMNFNTGDWGNEMGASVADYDNDGDVEFYLTNPGTDHGAIKADAFYRNDSDLSVGGAGLAFTHIGPVPGVLTDAATGVGWGSSFSDLDNDGDKELLTARGLGAEGAVNRIWRNEFPALASDAASVALAEVSASCPQFSGAGGGTPDVARGLVTFDFDNDGDLDVAISRTGSIPPLPGENLKLGFFRNDLTGNHNWLQVDLKEAGGSLNTVGARVWVQTGGIHPTVQYRESLAGSSYLSQEPYRLHFGLRQVPGADWIVVRWTDGTHHVVRADGPSIKGFRTIAHGPHDFTGDLDGNLATDCEDLALYVLGVTDASAVDAAVGIWPWRLLADFDGNGELDQRDFDGLRALVPDTFCDLGSGLQGTTGVVPELTGSGDLSAGSTVTLALAGAKDGSTATLFIGFELLLAPFKGGVLVPDADIVVGPLPTGPGPLVLAGTWPAAVPSGLRLTFQHWVADPAAVKGFSASNALSAQAP